MIVNSDIIVWIIVIVLGILIIKFVVKLFFRLIVILLIAGLGLYYIYNETDLIERNQDSITIELDDIEIGNTSIIELEKKLCTNNLKSRTDSIICECIITPLVNDLKQRFSTQELKELEKDKVRYIKEILAWLKRNKKQILKELKKRNATDVWDNIINELKQGRFL